MFCFNLYYGPSYGGEYKIKDFPNHGLTNIAGTLLNLLGYKNVEDYDELLIGFS